MRHPHFPLAAAVLALATLVGVQAPLSATLAAEAPRPGWFKKKKKKNAETRNDSTADPYSRLVAGAGEKHGLLSVYKKKGSYYFAIPDSLMGRDLLVQNKLQGVPELWSNMMANKGVNFEEQMVRFELDREAKRLRVRRVESTPLVPEGDAIARSVHDNFRSPLVASLPIEAWRKDSSAVLVKADPLYNGASTALVNLFQAFNMGYTLNRELSHIVRIEAFPNNIMAYAELSATTSNRSLPPNLTVEVSSSLILLPKEPMRPRESDPRLGYFTVERPYYADSLQSAQSKHFIARWRLEPKPEEENDYLRGKLVEPKHPIVFYIDPATPARWRPYICRGIEDWQVAFERAGFRNAIKAMVLSDSAAAVADDASTATVTYAASPVQNAMGPSTCDPRSGEIIDADIIWWHNVMSILKQWLTVQTAAVSPAARQPILPDSLMGAAIRFVACHEAGHSLGLRHNMRASAAVPTDSLRSPSFTRKFNATAASIMDYARFNYVAQPEDGVTPDHLMPHIGPYDLYAIEYGYRWLAPLSPQKEKQWLTRFVAEHSEPLYAYCGEQSKYTAIDPRGLSEDLGDDPVKSARLGVENLKRIAPHIDEWSRTGREEQTYDDAAALFAAVISQWDNYTYHVLANVGGVYINNVLPADGDEAFRFVPKERQEEAVDYLADEVLTYPAWLFDARVSRYTYLDYDAESGRTETNPALTYRNLASTLIAHLLAPARLARLLEDERLHGTEAFTAANLFDRLHHHLFGATERGASLSTMERDVQKMFVESLLGSVRPTLEPESGRSLNPAPTPAPNASPAAPDRQGMPRTLRFSNAASERASDIVSLKAAELRRIASLLRSKASTGDHMTRAHYADLLLRIGHALEANR